VAEEEIVDLAEFIEKLSLEFDEMCSARHAMGAEKYGPGKFLMVDTIEEALQEVADLANYARYSYIRLRLLQESIRLHIEQTPDVPGVQGFVSVREVFEG